jgi:hypothetical protein
MPMPNPYPLNSDSHGISQNVAYAFFDPARRIQLLSAKQKRLLHRTVSSRTTKTTGPIRPLVLDSFSSIELISRHAGGAHRRQYQHEEHKDTRDRHKPPRYRFPGPEIRPGSLAMRDIVLELVGAEFVVHKAAERDGVTEGLQPADWIAEDEHGGQHEEDVLEYAGQSHDQGGSLANLDIHYQRWFELIVDVSGLPRTPR